MRNGIDEVVLCQDVISHKAAGFPLAGDIGHPVQRTVAEARGVPVVVLQKGPVGIDGEQAEIPDPLDLGDHVPVQSGLPVPLAAGGADDAFFREIQSIGEFREDGRTVLFFRIPEEGCSKVLVVSRFRSHGLAVLAPGLASCTEIRAGERAQRAVARAVGEKRRFEGDEFPVGDVPAMHAQDAVGVHRHRAGVVWHENVDAFLPEDPFFPVVPEFLRGVGVAAFLVAEFLDQVAEVRIRIQFDATAQVDPYLGAVVAAKHGPVVDDGDFQSLPGRRDRRADPGDAAAHDDEIIGSQGAGLVILRIHLPVEPVQPFPVRGQADMPAPAQADGIAAAVESRPVLQGKRDGAVSGAEGAGVLPVPFAARRAANLSQRLAVHSQ